MNEQSTKNYWWRFKHEHVRHTRHLKPIYWGLFSVGGTIAALALAPIILVLCVLLPFGVLGDPAKFYHSIHWLVANNFVYLILVGIIFAMLWHGVHRFYYVLHDLHIHIGNRTRNSFYAIAILGALITLCVGW